MNSEEALARIVGYFGPPDPAHPPGCIEEECALSGGPALAALRAELERLRNLEKAASDFLAEMDSPAPCYVMRKTHRDAMRAALEEK